MSIRRVFTGGMIALSLVASAGCLSVDDVSTSHIQLGPRVANWRDEVIYQVLVDRYVNGDSSNDWRVNRNSLARYQGGDWQGIIEHLDYFTALGVTTLWISPIVRNVDTDAGIDGYHGYWASDLYELNPHFGSLATLRRLVQEAHHRNIHVVLDIVTNHMGQMFYYDINQNGRPDDNVYGGGPNDQFQNPGGSGSMLLRVTEFDPDYNSRGPIQSYTSLGPAGDSPVVFLNMPEIFRTPPHAVAGSYNALQAILARPEGYHRRGRIVNYDNDNATHQPQDQVMLGDFPGGLKDIATENPDVRNAMVDAYARWVELTDLDGFRIDTLKHVEHDFWREFGRRVRERLASHGKTNFFMFGEAFDGDDQLIASYTQENEMDSVFYFSQKFRVYRDIFQCEQPTQAIEALFTERQMNYRTTPQPSGANDAPANLLVNFFDNHDVARFLAGILDADPNSCPTGRVTDEPSRQRMKQKLFAALTYLFMQDGIPCVYYGTEQDFHGGNDPSNREVMWEIASDYRSADGQTNEAAGRLPTNGDTFQLISRLSAIRRAYEPLRRGTFSIKWVTRRVAMEQDAGIVAFERTSGDQTVLVVINAHSASTSETSASTLGGGDMTTSFEAGRDLVDVLSTSESPMHVTVGAGGTARVRLEPWQAVVLVRADQTHSLTPSR